MSLETSHPRDELQALLDERLHEDARERVERHLDGCTRCRGELDVLRRVKRQVAAISSPALPVAMRSRVLAALDAEDARRKRDPQAFFWRPLAAAAALVALLLVGPLWFAGRPDLATEVQSSVAAASAETLALEARQLSPSELEAWFVAQGLGFPARVFDFGAMSLQLVGGRVHTLAGEPGALYAYRQPDGTLVICQMYAGSIPEAGPGVEVHYRKDGVEFRTLRRDGTVLVFWQEGSVACVLGSQSLAPDEVRALAFAKALAA